MTSAQENGAGSPNTGVVENGVLDRVERVAVIDIGSNSIRLVVYDALKRSPLPVFNEKVLCGLGRGVEKTGRLNPEGVAQALDALERFSVLAAGMRVGRLDIIATAAVRDASDGEAFVDAVKARTGLEVRVISGEEEARLSALGVLSGTPAADGLVGDLGGGSLELVRLDRGVIGEHVTMPLGPLRLMESASGKQNGLNRVIDQHLEKLDWLPRVKGKPFYPVGGGWRALAKLHMEQVKHPLHIIHHYAVPCGEARDFAGLIAKQSRSSLEKMSGSRRRVDTLPYAALVFERLLRAAQPSTVVFSAFGLREGHLFSLLRPEVQRQDPLIAAADDWAQRFGRMGDPALLVSWTSGLFAGEDDAAQRLRQAACLLSDVGWGEHPDYRAEHACLRILRYPFPGVDHDERAFLALAVYARYAGTIDGPATVGPRSLLNEAQALKATVLGLALRLAHTLTGGATALLQRTTLKVAGERLTLTLPDDNSVPAGEAVQRRLDALAKALNRKGEIAPSARPQAA
ncbi:Ppx/GppA family phosphatase [Azospirillum rugosum]|uniref:Exopolyphosphatase/guanosine-5'-triphosphate, 3'-diphosphate pyrophosphatase n=1 Tax=Azospirillum rugosum TaxID=416170 RepID=A0ABS4SPB4_9PROT|nr:Ppx/GppA family phosphatase [Azospirillum rugosum]MBP2294405.1 exopolyphosphatase/guanosine-5'-triphosphate,3'-diphosphate pyrophosphatase [Azospirillum rugosum]MDQ0528910.1 exopolyphosphatase/guanosine-5'-triphosphate,3'-diphosphate pyrophosphatase [Azospirillum rugosum]